ncbi:MAG TPA: sensor domain-containing diguanylate cyclase, partial [Gaiellales bacterium]|nr:sensor domain-containing diguanylate cyclase [Gaiellales bacterium]
MLVGLALLPLIGVTLLVGSLLDSSQMQRVDAHLDAGASSAVTAYRGQLVAARMAATAIAGRNDVQLAFLHGTAAPAALAAYPQFGVELVRHGRVLGSSIGPGPAWRATVYVGPRSLDQRVVVTVTLDDQLLSRMAAVVPRAPGIDLALVSGGRLAASTDAVTGRVAGLRPGAITDATVGGQAVRAETQPLAVSSGGPALLVAEYPQASLQNAIDSSRLRLVVPALVLALVVVALALVAADRITRALTELAQRAMSLIRGAGASESGDELTELGTVIDQMSHELSTRMGELESERHRLKETLQRYGETLAATHDEKALLLAVLDTAVRATGARGGRLLEYNSERGEAFEKERIGSARGSRTDLPMVVEAGVGAEGDALARVEPRRVGAPRALLTVPIAREGELLGLVTVVDPDHEEFTDDDAETLAGLAVQAGVAIENARLHRTVQAQAITDELTGLANRRQFFDQLGREFERAQRFGQPLALIMLDIDDFKQINDTRGHLAGDAVLVAVAATVSELIREIDVAARYGGEEFAVLLPQTGADGATMLAERLRRAIEMRAIRFGGEPVTSVTASFGV